METYLWLVPLVSGMVHTLMEVWLWEGWKQVLNKPRNHARPPVSVIIAARNEAQNLSQNLPSILEQHYSHFEVIVILDRCTDESVTIIEKFQLQYSYLRCVIIDETPANWQGKKWALTQGIGQASFEQLLLTDADCQVGPTWIASMTAGMSAEQDVLLGLSPYISNQGLLNLFVRFETCYTAFQYIGFAQREYPYMAVGRNLAYTQQFFEKNGGFERFKGYVSGDDDLLVNAHAVPQKLGCTVDPKSYSYSESPHSWKAWWHQKTRHVSASHGYSRQTKLLIGIFHLSHLCFYAGIVVTLSANISLALIGIMYVSRLTISYLIAKKVYKTMLQQDIGRWWPLLDFLYFLYNLSVVPIGLIKKPSWRK